MNVAYALSAYPRWLGSQSLGRSPSGALIAADLVLVRA
jgi:hypothetical protein